MYSVNRPNLSKKITESSHHNEGSPYAVSGSFQSLLQGGQTKHSGSGEAGSLIPSGLQKTQEILSESVAAVESALSEGGDKVAATMAINDADFYLSYMREGVNKLQEGVDKITSMNI